MITQHNFRRLGASVVGVTIVFLGGVAGSCTAPPPAPTPPEPECTVDADCPDGEVCTDQECVTAPAPGPEATFATSHHGSREGKRDFYEAADGFFTLTDIPYNNLPCKDCHAATLADGTPVDAETYTPGCGDCHADPANPTSDIADTICLGCHGRQGAEQNLFASVHRDAGMECMDCHSAREMHGDGTQYGSFLAPGATDTKCENCHVEGGTAAAPPSTVAAHAIHLETVDCSACHVASVSSCYNCHFETEVAEVGKRFFNQSPRTGFKMLMNFEGKVQTATFQSLSYEGETFVAIAPFFGHSVTAEASGCGDCHRQGGAGNSAVEEYNTTGGIVVTSWDAEAEGADRLVGPTGVIPIPPDWKTALEFAFLDYTGDPTDAISQADNLPLWDFLKNEADGSHIVYGEPLTEAQMNALINN